MSFRQIRDELAARAREDLSAWPLARLQAALDFVDCDKLRQHYTGWIADLRREIARRAADSAKPPCSTCGGDRVVHYDDNHGEPRSARCPDCAADSVKTPGL